MSDQPLTVGSVVFSEEGEIEEAVACAKADIVTALEALPLHNRGTPGRTPPDYYLKYSDVEDIIKKLKEGIDGNTD